MVHVVTHNAASVDGRIDLLDVDLGTFYGLADRFDPDAHLAGSDTLIQGMAEGEGSATDSEAPSPVDAVDPAPSEPAMGGSGPEEAAGTAGLAPVLVVPDSRGRVEDWEAVRAQPYWRGPIVLCSQSTPESYLSSLDEQGVEYHVSGDDHVDYEAAFAELAERDGIETVLVDSGGTLSGHLFRAGLVDEVSVLVHPRIVGGTTTRSFVRGPDPSGAEETVSCSLESVERLDDDLVWLRYAVVEP